MSAGRKGGSRFCGSKMEEGGTGSSQWQLINSIKSAEGGRLGWGDWEVGDIFQPIKKVRGGHLSTQRACFSVNVAICQWSSHQSRMAKTGSYCLHTFEVMWTWFNLSCGLPPVAAV